MADTLLFSLSLMIILDWHSEADVFGNVLSFLLLVSFDTDLV